MEDFKLSFFSQEQHRSSFIKRECPNFDAFPSFIFLCGPDCDHSFSQIRESVACWLQENQKFSIPIMAEKAINRSIDIDYLTQETLLASLSSQIIISLESFGTAAELGAFTFLDSLCFKTIVIEDLHFATDRSFINLGPISKIGKRNPKNRLFLPINSWDVRNRVHHKKISEAALAQICGLVSTKRNFPHKAIEFITDSKGDRLLVVNDLFWYEAAFLELLYLERSLQISDLVPILCQLYDCSSIWFRFEREVSPDGSKLTLDFVNSLLVNFNLQYGFIVQNAKRYCWNQNRFEDLSHDGYPFGSVLFSARFRHSEVYHSIRVRRLTWLSKKGIITDGKN